MNVHTHRSAGALDAVRAELNDDAQFVRRCQDGVYGQLASTVAVDLLHRETTPGEQPSPSVLADQIIAEVGHTIREARPRAA